MPRQLNLWILVPAGFGLWWLAAGLSALGRLTSGTWATLIAVALLVIFSGLRRSRRVLVKPKTFRASLAAESVGIGLVAFGCTFYNRPDLMMPLIGMVVGLHLLSLGAAFDDRRFLLAGSVLTMVCLSSLLWRPPLRIVIAGLGAGSVLWVFGVWTSVETNPTS